MGGNMNWSNSCISTFGCVVLSFHRSSVPCAVPSGSSALVQKACDGDGNGLHHPKKLNLMLDFKSSCAELNKRLIWRGVSDHGWSDCPGMNSLQNGPTNHCSSTNEQGDVLLLGAEEFGKFLICLYYWRCYNEQRILIFLCAFWCLGCI